MMKRSDVEAAYQLFVNGMTSRDAAAIAGISNSSFAWWRSSRGLGGEKNENLRVGAADVCALWRSFIQSATGHDVFEKTRRRDVAWLRQALVLALHKDGHSYPNIAAALDMDHTTCLHAVAVASQCKVRTRWARAIVDGDAVSIRGEEVTKKGRLRAARERAEHERQKRKAAIVKDVLARHESGHTLREIAVSYNRTRAWASLLLAEAGHGIRRNAGLSQEDRHHIIEMARAGQSDAEIGRTLGCTSSTVRRHRLEAGVSTQHNCGKKVEGRRWSPKEDAKMYSLSLRGLSASAIGARLGRTRNSVCGRADRLGISLDN